MNMNYYETELYRFMTVNQQVIPNWIKAEGVVYRELFENHFKQQNTKKTKQNQPNRQTNGFVSFIKKISEMKNEKSTQKVKGNI